jgi:hypothetical protein
LAEIRNDNVPASIPQKQKTSKAERRAIQEAQRAAKAAAKEAGNILVLIFSSPSTPLWGVLQHNYNISLDL